MNNESLSRSKSFDAQPCTESKIDDLALGQFDAYRREAVDEDPPAEFEFDEHSVLVKIHKRP